MTTTSINNIHNLKHFNEINTLIQIEDLEVFATEINFLYEKLEQYASEIDAAVKNSELMKAAINDYENERQYLMDKIAEMQGTTNIYVFDKEDEYNDIQIQQEQEQEQKQADIIDIFNNIYKQEKQEQEQEQEKEQKQADIIDILNNIHKQEKQEQEQKQEQEKEQPQQKQESEEQEQQEETYIFHHNGMYDYDIKKDDEYIKRLNNKSPLNIYNTFEDYINNFSIYDKEDKKEVKKAIVEDFKKAGFKVKANNGYYNSLDIILDINKNDILDNQDLNYLSEKASNNYNYYEFQYYWDSFNKEISLYAPENIEILRNMINKRNSIVYNRFSLSRYEKDKKSAVELFYKKEVIEHILKTAKNILFKYSILKSYDAYSDYNSTYFTFDFDFIINLKD